MKMRWDDKFLYIGGFIEEVDVWANMTKHDSVVFKDNDFEVFIDADGSTHWYKEFEINAINTTWDLELNKPYMNGGSPNSSWEMPTMKSAIYVKGPINNPLVKDEYWTVELALPFSDLALHNKVSVPPKNKDQWRINFSRVEWKVRNVNGHYEKIPNVPEDNWVWSPQHSINMHLPERWGFVQFSSGPVNESKFLPDPNWPVYSSLVMIYNAEKEFFSVNGYFTANVTQLRLPDSVKAGNCHSTLQIIVHQLYNFEACVEPKDQELQTGHVRDDRLIWFTQHKLKV